MATCCEAFAAQPPNIVLIYTDDVGYGDVACYGSAAYPTPHIDRLAREGLRFTDAHSVAATCTPSRFSLLTGRYPFRQQGTGVLPGDARLIIEPGSVTLASLLKSAGYTTGVVGKWHLGLGAGNLDWNGEITPGPRELGFDYHYLIPATGDRVPCVYVEQGRVVGLDPSDPIRVDYSERIDNRPSGREAPGELKQQLTHGHDQTIVNGLSRIGWMTGGTAALWKDEEMADTITTKAVSFLEAHRDERFFLYFATQGIHVPRLPHPRFIGKSGLGPRGDAMLELDWSVGEILAALDRLGLADNTLVIFTSDNGPVLDDGYADEANERLGSHDPNGPWRGGKYSKFEGGTRVPMIARWPGGIESGSTSDALFSQVDFAATLAALTEVAVPPDACGDSRDELDTLLGQDKAGRPHAVHVAGGISIRQGAWKYVAPGPTRDGLGPWRQVRVSPPGRLFNLAEDGGEQHNLASDDPERLETLQQLAERIRGAGDCERE